MTVREERPARTGAPSRSGLSEAEARRRLAERGPAPPPQTSRSYRSIVTANVFTVFNLILLVFGVLTLLFADWRDALFLGVLVANSAIGITQEVRAKRALDRLAALVRPAARVVRDGQPKSAHVDELVVGDLVRLAPGDQVVADGTLVAANALLVDEAILSGESEPVPRRAGEDVRSGTFAVEGTGAYEVTAVGPESYAVRIAGEARTFRHPRSPLERALNRLLVSLVVVMVPLGLLLGVSLWERRTHASEAIPTSVAAVVSLIPEGLILLASVTYAVAALRMARRGALVQQLNAVESLASVDLLCLDKTGTLTENALRVVEVVGDDGDLGRFAASSPVHNDTLGAIAAAAPAETVEPEHAVPFSSRWRWSGLRLDGRDLVLGAPELFDLGPLAKRAGAEAASGRRVVAFGTSPVPLDRIDAAAGPPPRFPASAIVVIAERLRPEARTTVEYFRREGVSLKVLSGDRPETVAAIARDAGIPVTEPLDGRRLPQEPRALARAVEKASVVGRISPADKRRVVEALAADGHYVAMIGDGVNDVPALKASRLAIAQGGGTQMAKSVADLVLVRGDFAAIPAMVREGRQILRNLQRVARLFVTKSAFAAFLILAAGLTPAAYPLLPRHLTLAAALTIGIPAFFLALAPSHGVFRTPNFLRAVSAFSVPAGTAAGLGVVSSYWFALYTLDLPVIEARTVATTALIAIGLYFVLVLEASGRLRGAVVSTLVLALAAGYVLVLLWPVSRDFFALVVPTPAMLATAAGASVLVLTALWIADPRFAPGRAHVDPGP
ncbi:MAG TPA: HAD-IC family P-type ATPase [Gaiellaceae bacterium]|nr:HAD-IC family P-type ATPase [Gaiellaceae bacterium]